MTEPGLIERVLVTSGMINSNSNSTPCALEPLGLDEHGESMNESWKCAPIIGILMYLANNTCPDIAHAVHACARYTYNPKKSHTTAVKHILRYLKATMQTQCALLTMESEYLALSQAMRDLIHCAKIVKIL